MAHQTYLNNFAYHVIQKARYRKKEILILDDKDDVANTYKDLIEFYFGNTFSVIITNHGNEALEIIEKRKKYISFISTDLHHPGLYGIGF